MCTGVNTDHCSKGKKYADVVKAKVTEAKHHLLGEGEILDRTWEEMDVLFDKAWEEMVEELGGQAIATCNCDKKDYDISW
jgi:hypothetical protein